MKKSQEVGLASTLMQCSSHTVQEDAIGTRIPIQIPRRSLLPADGQKETTSITESNEHGDSELDNEAESEQNSASKEPVLSGRGPRAPGAYTELDLLADLAKDQQTSSKSDTQPERPCDEASATKSNSTRRERSHPEERRFPCDYEGCGKNNKYVSQY